MTANEIEFLKKMLGSLYILEEKYPNDYDLDALRNSLENYINISENKS
jgi:hypothetical protein